MDFNSLHVRRLKYNDENLETATSRDQIQVEETVAKLFNLYNNQSEIDPDTPILLKREHINYLKQCLTHLPATYTSLDCSRTWMCYWICHSLALMNYQLEDSLKLHITQFLGKCQCPDGGFGGGPGQAPHLAATYAAVNALCSLNTEEALKIIDRVKLKNFFLKMRLPSGAFRLEETGEVDIRGAYCAASVASVTNLDVESLFSGTSAWVISCQTYEGGFAGYPGSEAHGGYTFCGVATLKLLNSIHLCDIKSLLRWCAHKQTSFAGGFQGTTNKLVDGCYSFWQGGIFPIINKALSVEGSFDTSSGHIFNNRALQEYILICCQHPAGGLLDKPGKPRDIYHTCYTLSGLSIAQHLPNGEIDVVGHLHNRLMSLQPLCNVEERCLRSAMTYFSNLPRL